MDLDRIKDLASNARSVRDLGYSIRAMAEADAFCYPASAPKFARYRNEARAIIDAADDLMVALIRVRSELEHGEYVLADYTDRQEAEFLAGEVV